MTGAAPLKLPPELAKALEDVQQSRFSPFPLEGLAWLALAPAWSEQLAEASGFPLSGMTLSDFLAKTEKCRLCIRDPEPESGEESAEIARTLAALWPYLREAHRLEYHRWFESAALSMPDPEEGLYLLLSSDPAEGVERVSRDADLIQRLPEPEARARLFVQAALRSDDPRYSLLATHATQAIRLVEERAEARIALLERRGADRADASAAIKDVLSIREPARRAALLLRLSAISVWNTSLDSELAKTIGEIESVSSQSFYLSLLARNRKSADAAQRALLLAAGLTDAGARARALARIAVNCSEFTGLDPLQQAWQSALNVQDSNEQVSLLVIVASQWSLLDVQQAIRQAGTLQAPECRAEVLLACLQNFPTASTSDSDLVKQTIDQIPLRSLRERLEIRLASAAPYRDLARVVDMVRTNPDDNERRAALLPLLPRLAERDRARVADEILEGVRGLTNPTARRSALSQLIPWLQEGKLGEALTIATKTTADRGFRVEGNARRDIFEYVRKTQGALFLYNTAQACGQSILKSKSVGVSPSCMRWAQLASQLRDPNTGFIRKIASAAGVAEAPASSPAGAFLNNQVRQLVDAGDTGPALAWLDAGQLLAMAARGDVESAVLTGRHRVELSYRRAMDERHLRRYLERAEQTAAFENLRDGPDSRWALHYLGQGGVGKTMLLRHIMARLAVKNGQRLATSRVDFDHISPEFPVRKPGQLLAELADELRIYGGSSRIEEKFLDFQDRLLALHAELSAQPPPDDPLKNIRSPEFQEVIHGFCGLLEQFPPPVILILDTCEELSKLEPIAARLPSVEATFEILEQLLVERPSIRVVFAGRRLLAQSGDGWQAEEGALGERNRYLPAHKSYLGLHAIRGFTQGECSDFLERIADVKLDDERKRAILRRSKEVSRPIPIVWRPQRPETSVPRFNPFDVAMYAEWVRESKDVTADMIRSGQTDPYVEMRIIRRLENELVRTALPAVILLRRFDESMLRAIAPGDDERAVLFRDLQGQEWIDAQRDEGLGKWFLEVNPNLRIRMESYYAESTKKSALEDARGQLGPDLENLITASLADSEWHNQVNLSRLDATLRLLPAERAALLWGAIDRRVTEGAEWNWAFQICPQLLGEGRAAGREDAPLRAAIRATLNAALLHLQRDFDPSSAWLAVSKALPWHPIPEIRDWLSFRAELFAARDRETFAALGQRLVNSVKAFDPYRLEQLAAGFLGRLYETGCWPIALSREFPIRPIPLDCLYQLVSGTATEPPEMPTPAQRWADWRVPDCLTDRMRLEVMLGSWRNPAVERLWAESALRRLENIDSERLMSVLLSNESIDLPNLLERATMAKYYDPERLETCSAHGRAHPLYWVLANQWKMRGQPLRGIEILSRVRGLMLESRQPAEVVRRVDALLETMREPPRPPAPPAAPAPESRTAVFKIAEESTPSAAVAQNRLSLRLLYRVLMSLPALGYALLGLAMMSGVVFLGYKLVRLAIVSHHLTYVWVAVLIPIVYYFAPIYLNWNLKSLALVLRPGLRLSVIGSRVQANYHQRWGRSSRGKDSHVGYMRPVADPYMEQAKCLEDLATRLRVLRRTLLGGKLPVELHVDNDIQGFAWEALVHIGLTATGPVLESFQFWRTGRGDYSDSQLAPWKDSLSVVVLCRARDLSAMERTWAGRVTPGNLIMVDENSVDDSFLASRRDVDPPPGRVRAMHIVGGTRRSSGERLFQIVPERYFVPEQFPIATAHIFIVQCHPVESLERTDTDREQIAALRLVAADLFRRGAKTVIFLPRMPIAISDRVLAKLADLCMNPRAPSRFKLLDTVSDIRKIISTAVGASAGKKTEASQKYTHSESAAPSEPEIVDEMTLNCTRDEMSMDVSVWTRL